MSPPEGAGDRAELAKLLGRIDSFVRTAESLAQRNVARVRTLAALDLLAALWLGYAFHERFDWGWMPALVVFAVVAAPALVLWKIYRALKPMIGLPQRLADAVARMHGKASAYRQQLERRAEPSSAASAPRTKPKFAQLWESGRLIADLRGISGEAREIALEAGGALVLANPIFPVVLGVASLLATVVVALGLVVGLAYVV